MLFGVLFFVSCAVLSSLGVLWSRRGMSDCEKDELDRRFRGVPHGSVR